ncbi:leucyl aminopeptidase [Emticicia sp. CRIBPO]|uniref:leucyl aminopeptidase family protein n=1 Tax=Emticicia sp. CRIBPO TaxID=2683258 RepID=UPI0014126506|nr:leucyl aminopeptidase [Emticicia sp. CRIBPO]NBA87161.1 leucyl aminopeptidase [Emticicia sp. CRIBPO]
MNIKTGTEISAHSPIVVIPFSQGELLEGQLTAVAAFAGMKPEIVTKEFKAEAKESLLLFKQDSGQKIYLLGLGKAPKSADFIKIFRSFFYHKRNVSDASVAIDLVSGQLEDAAEFVVNGLLLASYKLGAQKTHRDDKPDFFKSEFDAELIVSTEKQSEVAQAVKAGVETAETQVRILALVDAPANYKTPQQLADFVLESGKSFGYKVEVFDEKQCEALGLHALLAVGKGSIENPPKFLVLEYKGGESKTIGLVGKGVTFDTGGVSLKPGDNMNYMKSDMGGAAAVIGTIELVARLKLPVHIVGVVPVTENCIDGLAIKPGDVIGSYAGKTIEVINTDAEGRLILADGLAYLKKNYNPEVMIDLATLTGNCIMALGYAASALLSNNDALAQQLIDAGQETGEKTWRMPLWDDYKDMMKSDVADIKNLSSAPIAGAITAAKFLETFIDEHPNWAHLDIAGVAFGDSEYGSMKSATAYGIRLLKNWIVRHYL